MTNKVEIRDNHPYGYRSGEWAQLIGKYTLKRQPVSTDASPELRECYVLVFPDGVSDLWPVNDSGYDYEFRDASE